MPLLSVAIKFDLQQLSVVDSDSSFLKKLNSMVAGRSDISHLCPCVCQVTQEQPIKFYTHLVLSQIIQLLKYFCSDKCK